MENKNAFEKVQEAIALSKVAKENEKKALEGLVDAIELLFSDMKQAGVWLVDEDDEETTLDFNVTDSGNISVSFGW